MTSEPPAHATAEAAMPIDPTAPMGVQSRHALRILHETGAGAYYRYPVDMRVPAQVARLREDLGPDAQLPHDQGLYYLLYVESTSGQRMAHLRAATMLEHLSHLLARAAGDNLDPAEKGLIDDAVRAARTMAEQVRQPRPQTPLLLPEGETPRAVALALGVRHQAATGAALRWSPTLIPNHPTADEDQPAP